MKVLNANMYWYVLKFQSSSTTDVVLNFTVKISTVIELNLSGHTIYIISLGQQPEAAPIES